VNLLQEGLDISNFDEFEAIAFRATLQIGGKSTVWIFDW